MLGVGILTVLVVHFCQSCIYRYEMHDVNVSLHEKKLQ